MANPALKNGYLSIATELVEKLAKITIPSEEMRLIWVVWRKTWGWKDGERHKDWDWISLSQFEKNTTIKHAGVVRGLKSLVVKRLLLKGKNGYKFNQNYDEWVVVKRLPPVVKRLLGSSQTTTKSSSQTTTNNRKKETITKEIYMSSFEKFWQAYPNKELKKRSMEIWKNKNLGSILDKILEFIAKAEKTDRWKKGFVKQPPTFLNGECWNDDLSSYNEKQYAKNRPGNALASPKGKYDNY